MQKRVHVSGRAAAGLLLGTALITASSVSAVEFAIVGPRAVGMGGAGVAVTTDALATYWNPAGLAMQQSVDIRFQASVQAVDRLGIVDTIDEINSFNFNDTSGPNQARLQGLVNNLNNGSISAIGAAGLYFKGYFGDHAFGFNISDVATGGEFAPIPLTVTCVLTCTINGQMAVRGLEARQAAFSYAYAFSDRTFSIGATAKIIQGAAYNASVGVVGSESGLAFTSDLGKPEISTAIGIDAGAIYRPSSWLRFGVVGKNLNQPTFDAPNGQEFKLVPQVRAGVAVNPYESLTLTFDGDITSNKTFVPGIKSRVLSLGAEQTLPAEFISLRVGALKNVEDAKSIITPTAGFGIRFFALRMDFGGGYDFQQGQALASGSVSMTF
jgi:F plasmid transfer operon, TraF, protein